MPPMAPPEQPLSSARAQQRKSTQHHQHQHQLHSTSLAATNGTCAGGINSNVAGGVGPESVSVSGAKNGGGAVLPSTSEIRSLYADRRKKHLALHRRKPFVVLLFDRRVRRAVLLCGVSALVLILVSVSRSSSRHHDGGGRAKVVGVPRPPAAADPNPRPNPNSNLQQQQQQQQQQQGQEAPASSGALSLAELTQRQQEQRKKLVFKEKAAVVTDPDYGVRTLVGYSAASMNIGSDDTATKEGVDVGGQNRGKTNGDSSYGTAFYPVVELSDHVEKEEALDAVSGRNIFAGLLGGLGNVEDGTDDLLAPAEPVAASEGEPPDALPGDPQTVRKTSVQDSSKVASSLVHTAAAASASATPDGATVGSYIHKVLDNSMSVLTRRGYKGGLASSQVNQDRIAIVSPFLPSGGDERRGIRGGSTGGEDSTAKGGTEHDFFMGIFDGHGDAGHVVSHYVVQRLPALIASKLGEATAPNGEGGATNLSDEVVSRILTESFVYVDHTVPKRPGSGCTASTVLRLGRKLYVANTGDSRSLVARYSRSTGTVQILYSSRFDKPHLPEEKARIEQSGGLVNIPSPYLQAAGASSRVVVMSEDGLSFIGLAMSRSIGDHEAEAVGVIPDPTVHVMDLMDLKQEALTSAASAGGGDDANDDAGLFAVVASDGLFDHLTVDHIVSTLGTSLYGGSDNNLGRNKDELWPTPAILASENLIMEASELWIKNSPQPYRDDISVAVTKIIV